MALNPKTLKADLLALFSSMRGKTEVSDSDCAGQLAAAIDKYIKTAAVTVAAGISVATSGTPTPDDPTSQTGATTATGTGTIS